MAATKREQTEAREQLRERLANVKTVYTILRRVSASGMSRIIDLVIVEDGEIRHIGWNAARALGWSYDPDKGGIRVSGCGMDMGFHLVYELSAAVFGYENRSDYRLKHSWL